MPIISQNFILIKTNAFTIQKGYMLWHTPMAWKSANLTLGAWVKNLTNEEYSHLKFDLVKQTTTRLSRVYLIK